MTIDTNAIALAYLISGVLIVLGLNRLSRPATARRGNTYAMTGMSIAILATLAHPKLSSYEFIVWGMLFGGVIGTSLAYRIKMTAVPQLVALLHSFVGLAAVLIAVGICIAQLNAGTLTTVLAIELCIGAAIGAVTFTGSLIAFGKLQALISTKPMHFKGQHVVNLAIATVLIGLIEYFILTHSLIIMITLVAVAMVLGALLILPIGGPDMPVVISMLNSYSGWAAAATGFTLGNPLLIMTGALVGFSGAILSYIMCKAMNRTLFQVILGGFGREESADNVTHINSNKPVKTASVEDATFMMTNASRVIIVPGYGMAVAQAQQAVKELVLHLSSKNVDVKFAIHPVAGRMPGHMNVLLAEADIPFEQVFEMEEINPEFADTDVVLVVGANDVTNPAAKNDSSSPIYGMPILDVSKATHTFFIKRSMKPGYSGVDNQLFYKDNCSLVFGDAKDICQKMATEFSMAA